ncbi:hypothetical protein [Ferrimonas sp. YFM]|uniref:hypothetical protein n=1 Tax=Ferrimonas sp. YFM TaxID=3028878 RepID=UPI002573222F|nr:hypothetical protein [Ferrimonas sp. YFM]BDY03911.1 hypothetical protein F0521_09520 [Ferrimonas sp. YFM]
MPSASFISLPTGCSNPSIHHHQIARSLKRQGVALSLWQQTVDPEEGYPQGIMDQLVEQLRSVDMTIMEVYQDSMLAAVAAGYSAAAGKPLILLKKHGCNTLPELEGMANRIIHYDSPEQIRLF